MGPTTTIMNLLAPDLLRQMDLTGPRYTSYPTADRFVEAFGQDDYVQALEQRRVGLSRGTTNVRRSICASSVASSIFTWRIWAAVRC
jgi:hypothetical protein